MTMAQRMQEGLGARSFAHSRNFRFISERRRKCSATSAHCSMTCWSTNFPATNISRRLVTRYS